MNVFLRRRAYFTFRGVGSDRLDLMGRSVSGWMRDRLGAVEIGEEEIEEGVVLDPVYPFLTSEELFSFVEGREGSYLFRGGFVKRRGIPLSPHPRMQTAALGQGFFSLADYPAALSRAARESAQIFSARGALVEEGAEVSLCSELGAGAIVRRGARLVGRCAVGENAEIGSGSQLFDSTVGAGTVVLSGYLERATVGRDCRIGPYAYLRPQTVVGDGCRVGDFVELKNARVGAGCKIAHLAYVGDAELGERVNVGCGAVFVNYDGKKKSRAKIGNGCFIGSNCNLIAPLTLGDGAFVAAGSTLTKDLSEDDFCIARCRETVKPHRGKHYYDPQPDAPK